MKIKLFLLMILSLIITTAFSQSTVTVSINGVKKGAYTLKADQTDGGIVINKSDCKKLNALTVQIKGEYIGNAVYKKTLNISDNSDKVLFNLPETKSGLFTITNAKIKALLLKGGSIKLHLLMEPADSRMMISSKYIYMGTLSAK